MTIDWWTLGIQTVNVAILVWLLQRFFWRPVAAMIESRRASTQAALADAETIRAKAESALKDIETTRAGFATEREAILTAAREAGTQARTKLLEDAAKAAAALETTAKTAIEKERQAAEAAWSDRSSHLAIDIAGRLASRLDGAAVRRSFLDWLIKAVGTLPDRDRQATSLEAISAAPLDPAEQAIASSLIGKAFGGDLAIEFKTDPTLIAGLELRGPHLMVSNSWRADLAKIRADLTHGP
jgi:F-type H+-transporting ATPase subunit b